MRRTQLRVRRDDRPEFLWLRYLSLGTFMSVALLLAGLMLWRGVPPPQVDPVAAKPTVVNPKTSFAPLPKLSSWFKLPPCSTWYSSDQLYTVRLKCQMQMVPCSHVYIVYVEEMPNVRAR